MRNLGAKRLNQLEDDIVQEAARVLETLTEYLLDDGYPYGFDRATEREEYDHLVEMKLTNNPSYWEDPAAVQRLAQLEVKYGPAPNPAIDSLIPLAPGLYP